MSNQFTNLWQVNGVYLPRNPSDFDFKPTKANVSYVDLLDGSVRRQRSARKIGSREVTLSWVAVDAVVRRKIMATFVADSLNVITMNGMLPKRTFSMYYDDFDVPFTKEGYESRPGFGGIREDLKITGQSPDAWFSSAANVPAGVGTGWTVDGASGIVESTPVDGLLYDFYTTTAFISANFTGPNGGGPADGLPAWTNGVLTGQAWQRRISDSMAGATQSFYFQNLGDAEWLPKIVIANKMVPVTGMAWALNIAIDVDGTGEGVDFIWFGTALGNGETLLFDTKKMRAYRNGVETQAFDIVAHSSGLPFSYWPAMPPGTTLFNLYNVQTASVHGVDPNPSYIDLSNGGTNVFRYL